MLEGLVVAALVAAFAVVAAGAGWVLWRLWVGIDPDDPVADAPADPASRD